MGRLTKAPYIVMFVFFGVFASMFISSSYLDATFSDTKIITNQIPTLEEKTLATPTITLVKSEKVIVVPQETDISDSAKSYKVSPKISKYSEDSSTLKIMNPAFAIPVSDVDVTLDVWSLSGNPISTEVTSTDIVYFLESSENEIVSLNPITNATKEWVIPNATSGNGDIAINSTDSIFFVLINDELLGHLNPSTNLFTMWNLTTTAISGIAVDSSGNVFFADNSVMKRLNPSTNVVTTWDPSFVFGATYIRIDSNGLVYSTNVGSSKITRLNPSTGEIIQWTTPSAGPFGLSIDSSDNVFFAEITGNKIAMLDPTNDMVTEWDVPTPASAPRDVVVDSNDIVYFTENAVDKIGRLDPSTNVFTEWTIPSINQFRGIAVDSSDNIYAPDFGTRIIRLR